MPACQVCRSAGPGRVLTARERMFGLGDEFEYLECGACGCVQLLSPPEDLSRYYPADYYSFRARPEGALVRRMKQVRLRHVFGRRTLAGAVLVARYGVPPDVAAVRRAGIGRDEAILDVGCGEGRLLRELQAAGFTKLTGVDPYLAADVEHPGGIRIWKRSLAEVEGRFDWVMLHHSFEHMPDPAETLGQLYRLLRPGGRALIRIPVADSYAWRTYGADWVQLDAPRHFFLHTRRSLRILAEAAGFVIESVECDSTDFQFWGSEQYRRGIPLQDPRSHAVDPRASGFRRAELRDFRRRAAALNRKGDGDQACFVLRRG